MEVEIEVKEKREGSQMTRSVTPQLLLPLPSLLLVYFFQESKQQAGIFQGLIMGPNGYLQGQCYNLKFIAIYPHTFGRLKLFTYSEYSL